MRCWSQQKLATLIPLWRGCAVRLRTQLRVPLGPLSVLSETVWLETCDVYTSAHGCQGEGHGSFRGDTGKTVGVRAGSQFPLLLVQTGA